MQHGITVVQQVNVSSKNTYVRADALQFASQVDRISVFKGKQTTVFDLTKQSPSEEELLEHLLGPTGNLRAPTLLVQRHMIVGFQAEGYGDIFGL